MHWPSPFKAGDNLFPKGDDGKVITGTADYVDTYKAMEKVSFVLTSLPTERQTVMHYRCIVDR